MWETGRAWGFRLYMAGTDPGTEFTIQRMERMREEVPMGPNAYNPYQIPPGPLAPGGPQNKKNHSSPCPNSSHIETYSERPLQDYRCSF
jgi:hypothetical protein